MFTAIVFLPLFGFLIAGAMTLFPWPAAPSGAAGSSHGHGDHGSHDDDHAGHRVAPYARAAELVTSGLLIVAALLSWIAFFRVGLGEAHGVMKITVMPWIHTVGVAVDWSLRIDTLTVVMLVVVNTISALVHVYSIGYMAHDPDRPRFFAFLSLFTFAMLTLVTADNLVQMFFGWEGVGLASYLLIGFWFQRPSANAAAIKAFVVNRVGDFGFVLGIFGVFWLFGTIDLDTIFASAGAMKGKEFVFLGGHVDALTTLCLLLFLGAMGKSAQFLLHTWLPDAMEGPTPVSALIHAATMVTAGVFMVARLSPLFEQSPTALAVVTLIGATTAFFAATVGLVQNDIKRVIAYSTCSQLGYMFVALGVGAYGAGIFHLFTHAFFKALLFLGAGSVIHAVSGEQDMRKMGGLAPHIRLTFALMVIGTLALTGVGLPTTEFGFAGYNSKDAIIEAAYVGDGVFAGLAFVLLVTAALFTSFYSWRLIFLTFFGKPRADAEVMHHVHESPAVMTIPLALLALGAVVAGMAFSAQFIGHGYGEFWKGALFTGETNHVLEHMHHVPLAVKFAPFVAMLIGFVTAFVFYIVNPELPVRAAEAQPRLYDFLLHKWYFDELYDRLFVEPAKKLGRFLWKEGDGRIIDGFGPDGVSARVVQITGRVVALQSGYLYHYAFAMLIGVALLGTFVMFGGVR